MSIGTCMLAMPKREALQRGAGLVGLVCGILLLACGNGAAAPVKETAAGDGKHDQYGDPLPKGAILRLGTVRLRHHSPLICVAISPDGTRAASTGKVFSNLGRIHNPIRIWNLNTGREISRLVGHTSDSVEVSFSPDGKTLASVAVGVFQPDKSVRLWNVASGTLIRILKNHSDLERNAGSDRIGLAFSHDSRLLASSGQDDVIRIWEVSTGTQLRHWKNESADTSLAFSPDGTELVSAAHGIRTWDVSNGKQRSTFAASLEWIQSLRYTADGACFILQSHKRTVEWWDRRTEKEIKHVPGSLLGFSTNGKWAAILHGKDVQIWDVVARIQIRSFAADQRFIFGGGYSYWGGLSADGSRLATADLMVIRAVRTSDGKDLQTLLGHGSTIHGLAFIDKDTLMSAADYTLRWWDVRTGKELARRGEHFRRIVSTAPTPDSKTLCVGHGGGKVKVWDLTARKEVFSYDLKPPSRPLVCFSLDGSRLAIQSDLSGEKQPFRLIDTQGWKELRRLNFGNSMYAMGFLPGNGEILHPSGDGYIFDLNEGKWKKLPETVGFSNQYALAPSPDGRFMALGHIIWKKGGAMRLWETVSRKTVWLVDTDKMDPTAVVFSADNTTVAMGSRDGEIGLWDARTGALLERFTGHLGDVRALAFSRDGKRLASGSADTTILIWDIAKTMSRPRPASVRLKDDEILDLWTRLGSEDVPAAQSAVWRLVDAGEQTTTFLAKELFVAEDDDKCFERLIEQLDDASAKTRARAMQELIILGRTHTKAAKQALAKATAPRVKQRLESILAAYEGGGEQKLRHRQVRVLQVLEALGTDAASRLLKRVADTHPAAQFRSDAKEAFDRLGKRGSPKGVRKETDR